MASSVATLLFLLAATPVVAHKETCDPLDGKDNCQQENDDDGQALLQIAKSEIEVHETGQRFRLKMHTCDISHAGTDSHVQAKVGGQWVDLDHWWHNDREQDYWDAYLLDGNAPSDIELKLIGRDGWCVDYLEIDGVELHGTPRWLDTCDETHYDNIPCSTSASFTTVAPTPAPAQLDQDLLTVMTFNTYLLRVNIIVAIDTRPNLDERQALIADWFATLDDAAVPDVLVLQEVYSSEAQDMLRTMCNPAWTKNADWHGGHSHDPYISCTVAGSKFAYATKCVNPTTSLDPRKTGGVVVLVKKGTELESATDIPYEDCAGEECFTVLGFWAVKFRKGSQPYWFFGTHAIAYEKPKFIAIRQKQFKQMRAYINEHVEDGARLAIAGDMNIFTGDYVDEHNETQSPDEINPMLENLGSPNAPAIGGDHVPQGFWLPLDQPMSASADPVENHVIAAIPGEARLGHQRFDWVITPGPGDAKLATPDSMRYQIVPVKSNDCFDTEQTGYAAGTKTDDLSDHYAVFAEIKWTAGDHSSTPANGHRGAKSTIPHGPTC